MSGPLNSIFTAVNARMPTGVTTHVGAEWLFAQESPPRIVWIPKSESYGTPTPQGGDGRTNPSPLWTRRSSVECHIWTADLDSAESLLQTVIQTLQSQMTMYSYQAVNGQWIASDGEAIKLGVVYLLTVEFSIPVTRKPDVTTTLVRMPITPQI